jgi:formyl-CoA transferase
LLPLLQQRLRTRPAAEWLALLEKAQIPATPVNHIDQVFDDAQVQARGLRIELAHASGVPVPMVRNPLRFSATPLQYTHAAPVLGEHSGEVLRELLALDDDELQRLVDQGVLQADAVRRSC